MIIGNKGSHGIDGMKVDELLPYLKEKGDELTEELKAGTYRPKPVRRVEIPKPDGGVRLLGIPTVVDRMLQQAIAQILTPIFDPDFSDSSFGFRPGRSAHQAIKRVREKIRAITSRSNGKSMDFRLLKLKQLINGWVNYFKLADMKSLARALDEWTRRRLRMCIWKQWKKVRTRFRNLMKLGLDRQKAWEFANTRKSYQ